MTRIGGYCFDARVLIASACATVGIVLFLPSILQAAVVLIVGTCPVTSIFLLSKVSRLHVCGEREEPARGDRGREGSAEPLPGPYAGLAQGMFGKRR